MSAPRPWTVLVDGVAGGEHRALREARWCALYVQHTTPGASVAVVRLGLPRTLRRFEAGREVIA